MKLICKDTMMKRFRKEKTKANGESKNSNNDNNSSSSSAGIQTKTKKKSIFWIFSKKKKHQKDKNANKGTVAEDNRGREEESTVLHNNGHLPGTSSDYLNTPAGGEDTLQRSTSPSSLRKGVKCNASLPELISNHSQEDSASSGFQEIQPSERKLCDHSGGVPHHLYGASLSCLADSQSKQCLVFQDYPNEHMSSYAERSIGGLGLYTLEPVPNSNLFLLHPAMNFKMTSHLSSDQLDLDTTRTNQSDSQTTISNDHFQTSNSQVINESEPRGAGEQGLGKINIGQEQAVSFGDGKIRIVSWSLSGGKVIGNIVDDKSEEVGVDHRSTPSQNSHILQTLEIDADRSQGINGADTGSSSKPSSTKDDESFSDIPETNQQQRSYEYQNQDCHLNIAEKGSERNSTTEDEKTLYDSNQNVDQCSQSASGSSEQLFEGEGASDKPHHGNDVAAVSSQSLGVPEFYMTDREMLQSTFARGDDDIRSRVENSLNTEAGTPEPTQTDEQLANSEGSNASAVGTINPHNNYLRSVDEDAILTTSYNTEGRCETFRSNENSSNENANFQVAFENASCRNDIKLPSRNMSNDRISSDGSKESRKKVLQMTDLDPSNNNRSANTELSGFRAINDDQKCPQTPKQAFMYVDADRPSDLSYKSSLEPLTPVVTSPRGEQSIGSMEKINIKGLCHRTFSDGLGSTPMTKPMDPQYAAQLAKQFEAISMRFRTMAAEADARRKQRDKVSSLMRTWNGAQEFQRSTNTMATDSKMNREDFADAFNGQADITRKTEPRFVETLKRLSIPNHSERNSRVGSTTLSTYNQAGQEDAMERHQTTGKDFSSLIGGSRVERGKSAGDRKYRSAFDLSFRLQDEEDANSSLLSVSSCASASVFNDDIGIRQNVPPDAEPHSFNHSEVAPVTRHGKKTLQQQMAEIQQHYNKWHRNLTASTSNLL